MRHAALWLAGIIAVVAARPAAADVGDYIGRPVAALEIEVEGRPVIDARLIALIETRQGTPLSMRAVRQSVTHLMALGRYEDVRVAADPAPGNAVKLTYDLVPVHPIERIVFEGVIGVPGIDEGRLRRVVIERFGASPSAARRLDVVRVVADDLGQHGYLHPVVDSDVEIAHDPDRATLVFRIQPGIRTTIRRVEVAGSAEPPTADFFKRLGLSTGAVYERDAIGTKLREYQRELWDGGHVEAKVSLATRFDEGDATVDLTLTVTMGPDVRLVFEGDQIPRDKREELVPVVVEASASEDLLEDSTTRIEDYLHGQGYRDATAPHTRQEGDGTLTITFTITRGPLYRVADVAVSGNQFETLELLLPRPATRKGQVFAQAKIDADVAAIENAYRRQGFAGVQVETSFEPLSPSATGEVGLNVTMSIAEGVRTVVNSVVIRGNDSVAEGDLLRAIGLRPGSPFFLTQMAVDRDTIQLAYANRGYQSTTVEGNPGLVSNGATADVVFTVREGPQLIVDHVMIVGNVRTKTETIERELHLKAGDPLGLSAIVESQQDLAKLGLFRRVRFTQVPHGDENRRDLVVTIEESPVTTIGYGGGLEVLPVRTEEGSGSVEDLDFAPRAFFEVGRRNLFGKNRSINLFTRVSFRPDAEEFTANTGPLGLSEYRVFGAFREPRLFDSQADAFITGTIEQQRRSTFAFSRRAFNTELARRLTQTVTVNGNYQIQRTFLFDENIAPEDRLLIDRLYPQVLISSFSSSAVASTKDDVVNPTAGRYLSATAQIAAEAIGSEVGFFKTSFTAQAFRSLPQLRRSVLATSVRVGLAHGFAQVVTATDADGNPILDDNGQVVSETLHDLPASERFFAGGDTSVRGFAQDQLGAPSTLDTNGVAIGGGAVLILNAELRVPLRGNFGVVGFVDAGNVFAHPSEITFGQIRSAVGFGVRYLSPIGPIRFDVGFKTQRLELTPGNREAASAIHISIGQAF